MDAEKASFPVRFMAERLGVSPSGFYEWRQRQEVPCRRRVADAELSETIVEIWRQSRGTYGSPASGPSCGWTWIFGSVANGWTG